MQWQLGEVMLRISTDWGFEALTMFFREKICLVSLV